MSSKIKCKKEGRPNLYLPDLDSIYNFVNSMDVEYIHNFIGNGNFFCGCDYAKSDVLEDIKSAEKIGILTTLNMGHALVIIKNNERYAYDIGKINEDNLEIYE